MLQNGAAARRCNGPCAGYIIDISASWGSASDGAAPMAPAKQKTEKDYDDIPGTYVFDADRSREGYHLNMFCMSLMKAENRKAFKDKAGYTTQKYLDSSAAHARAARGDPQAPVQPDAGTRRQHLFHRQARRDRRPSVPASCGADDRLDPAGLCRPDAARRPLGRRQPQQVRQVRESRVEYRQGGQAETESRSKGKKRRG